MIKTVHLEITITKVCNSNVPLSQSDEILIYLTMGMHADVHNG